MKIVITGGLGYIGTELCRLYSGEARKHDIVVFDNRFLPARIAQLHAWGIRFVQGSICDLEAVREALAGADLVFHLAGITDVAYVKTEVNSEQDLLIRMVAIHGTNNVLESISPETRLVFPSTHVVFEGIGVQSLLIPEEAPTSPILAYSSSKVQNEIDIRNKSRNYIILRLGSVYGLSEDSMRMNIMPNLFSKIAAFEGTIKLFGGGKQYKSLVHIGDVARCFKFLAEQTAIKQEIFHVSNETLTVAGVANLCKKYAPNVTLESTDDPIPNLGYALSNKKLLDTGFRFFYNLPDAIKEMIEKWKYQAPIAVNEVIHLGKKATESSRGVIINYDLTEPINLIGYITSKAGTMRANHYHPIQEQKCLLVKGSYVSVTKDLFKADTEIQTELVLAGNISIIPPNVAHTMIFLEDSIVLNLVRGDRDHAGYGITHTIPYPLVDENMKEVLLRIFSKQVKAMQVQPQL